jgi:hypothetical protein
MTLNEIAYNLLNLVRGGRSHHDEHISLDQIKFNVMYYRAMFIRRDYAKNGFVSRHVEQDLGCIKLIKVDASKCCNLPINCAVYRTEETIPKTIRRNFEESITHVGDVTGLGTIPFVESNAIQWIPYDKYTKDKMKAYMIEDYLYVYNADGLEFINVKGIFENPKSVEKFADCGVTGNKCYSDDYDYPIPMDMITMINQGILSGELTLLSSSMSDTYNDRMQDVQTKQQPSKKQD